MMHIDKVIVDGNLKLNYAGFYLYGLRKLFPGKIQYSFNFKGTNNKEHTFAFILRSEKNEDRKVIIDFHDSVTVDEKAFEWCDLYAKINYNADALSKFHDPKDKSIKDIMKIIPIPPSFGIRVFNAYETLLHLIKTVLYANSYSKHTIPNLLRAYYKRLPLSYYNHQESDSNYIFYIGSIWNSSDAKKVTEERAEFIRAAKKIQKNTGVKFEGGLIDIGYDSNFLPDLKQIKYADAKVNLKNYISKTQKSLVGFNNPAVQGCHGWKIAEFLSLGKAIISFPLLNDLENPLQNGKEIIYVNNIDEIYHALQDLIENKEKRRQLEENALKYWREIASPEEVIKFIIRNLNP